MTITLQDLITIAQKADAPTLDGFNPQQLPEAAAYRIARLADRGTLDRYFSEEDLTALQEGVPAPEPAARFSGDHAECAYLVFEDGSFYYQNNAQDEVWGSARDFIAERLLRDCSAEDYAPESDEGRLIRHCTPGWLEAEQA